MIGDHARVDTSGGAVVLAPVKTSGGDFIGRDQVTKYINHYHIEVKVLQASSLNKRQQILKLGPPNPYLPARPFKEFENPLFTGRKAEVEQLLHQINSGQTQASVVYGAPDMGKTSLLLGGVLPEIEAESLLVIKLQDYSFPVPFIRSGLIGRAKQLQIPIGNNPGLTELAEGVCANSDRIILVLDQFERYFLPGLAPVESEALVDEITALIKALDAQQFHILVGIRNEFQADFDRLWGKLVPDFRKDPVHLQPLLESQAVQAIEHPLDVFDFPASFTDDIVGKRLLPDLDVLYEPEENRILPGDLQIVCHNLYQAARNRRPHHINTDLYLEISDKKGADRLLDLYFENKLAHIPRHYHAIMEHVFETMLTSQRQSWFKVQELARNGFLAEDVEKTLTAMTDAQLLTWHLEEMQPTYGFANYSIQREAQRIYGREAYKAHQARNELEYVWRAWIAYNAWAKPDQLAYIREHFQTQTNSPEKALLTLRSAIKLHLPVDFWLNQLKGSSNLRLLKRIEGQTELPEDDSTRLTQMDNARLLLGLYDDEMPAHPGSPDFGHLTWGAVAHPKTDCRETAVLALGSAYEADALTKLEKGISAGEQSKARLAELRGMLMEAEPAFEQSIHQLPHSERGRIWWWRFRRRFGRDYQYLGTLSIGGAIGAGFALGLLRAILAVIVIERPGVMFYNYFPMGFVTGGLLALGMFLIKTLQLKPLNLQMIGISSRSKIIAGAVGFAVGQILLNLFFSGGLSLKGSFSFLMAFLAGLALSIATRDQPRLNLRLKATEWFPRSIFVAFVFILIQVGFILSPDWGIGLVFVWSGEIYESLLMERIINWGLEGILTIPNWYHLVGILDAALAGIALFFGLTTGLVWANRLYQKIQTTEG